MGDMRTAVSGGALRWHVALTMKMSTIDASPPPSSECLQKRPYKRKILIRKVSGPLAVPALENALFRNSINFDDMGLM